MNNHLKACIVIFLVTRLMFNDGIRTSSVASISVLYMILIFIILGLRAVRNGQISVRIGSDWPMRRSIATGQIPDNILGNTTLSRLRLMLLQRDFNENDYEQLLQLDEENLTSTYPTASLGEIQRLPVHQLSTDHPKRSCAVCLEPYENGETLRTLPCLHQFHTGCIDPWLQKNAICPVCKFPALGG